MRKDWKIFFVFVFTFSNLLISTSAFAQRKLEKEKTEIMGEGLALYTLILANWTSTDLYYENEFNIGSVKGYLSYKDKDTLKTIFWKELDTASAEYKAKNFKQVGDTGILAAKKTNNVSELRVVLKTFCYPKMIVTKKNASIREEEREPTDYEKMLMDFRARVYSEIGKDTAFYKEYKGTSLKAIPLDAGKQIKIYVYSSSTSEDFIPLGGDYLIVYSKKDTEEISKEKLHDNIIFISTHYRGKASDASKFTYHNHKGVAPELITPTDIATLLLYKSSLEWDEHHVVSDKYTCIFTLIDRKLQIMPTSEYEAIQKKKVRQDKEALDSNFH